ncbi:uncharacterized protein [Halyomorpha halys]|uniref:uncharacterized protein n=1 Tax=Halyomorpha halys TaxID=286706 RepID=UPI0034D22B01
MERYKAKSYRLKPEEMANYFQEEVERMTSDQSRPWDSNEIDTSWVGFRKVLLDASKLVRGEKNLRSSPRRTAWWTEDVKKAIQEKKGAWKNPLSLKTPAVYQLYMDRRKEAKLKVLEAKKKSWEDFGRKLEEKSKENQEVFYRVLKGMRGERPTSLKGIKDRNGDIIWRDELIMESWREYFQDLLEERDVKLGKIQRRFGS